DGFPIWREERTAIVAWCAREPAHVRAVDVHRVDVEISVFERREHDGPAVRRQRSLCRVHTVAREAAEARTVVVRGVDVARVQSPDIALRRIGARRARRISRVRRTEKNLAVCVEEVAASRLACSGGYAMHV